MLFVSYVNKVVKNKIRIMFEVFMRGSTYAPLFKGEATSHIGIEAKARYLAKLPLNNPLAVLYTQIVVWLNNPPHYSKLTLRCLQTPRLYYHSQCFNISTPSLVACTKYFDSNPHRLCWLKIRKNGLEYRVIMAPRAGLEPATR